MATALKSPRGNVVYVENDNRVQTLVSRGYEVVNEAEPAKGVAATDDYDAELHDVTCPECGSTDHTTHPKTRRSKKSDTDS